MDCHSANTQWLAKSSKIKTQVLHVKTEIIALSLLCFKTIQLESLWLSHSKVFIRKKERSCLKIKLLLAVWISLSSLKRRWQTFQREEYPWGQREGDTDCFPLERGRRQQARGSRDQCTPWCGSPGRPPDFRVAANMQGGWAFSKGLWPHPGLLYMKMKQKQQSHEETRPTGTLRSSRVGWWPQKCAIIAWRLVAILQWGSKTHERPSFH